MYNVKGLQCCFSFSSRLFQQR